MGKRKKQPDRLEIGMEVTRTPETIYDTDGDGKGTRRPMRGCVVYIHPRGLYHTVAFKTLGGTIKESFKGVEV